MPDPRDPQLDDLRRRARRRLVGAVVLALAAAVLVPMLLESDPKPLGEDVSVKIPPIDEGKFVNKLGERAKATETPAVAPAPPPVKSSPAAEPVKETPKPPVEAPKPAPEPPKTLAAAPESATKIAEPPKAPADAAKAGAFSVQLAAFIDDKGANALAGKLKKAGYPAYTEPYSTSRGTLWRVRVGPYASREAAEAARTKLKGEGQNGIIATGK